MSGAPNLAFTAGASCAPELASKGSWVERAIEQGALEAMARAIAADLGRQDCETPFVLNEDYTIAYLDQGEVNFLCLAVAALTAAASVMDQAAES